MKKYSHTIAVVVTIIVLVTAYLGYTFYKEINVVNQDDATLAQVVNFINQQVKANQAPSPSAAVTK